MTSKSRREKRAREAQEAIERAVSGWFDEEPRATHARPFGKLPGWTIVETEDEGRTTSELVTESVVADTQTPAGAMTTEQAADRTQVKARRKRRRNDGQPARETDTQHAPSAVEPKVEKKPAAAQEKPTQSAKRIESKAAEEAKPEAGSTAVPAKAPVERRKSRSTQGEAPKARRSASTSTDSEAHVRPETDATEGRQASTNSTETPEATDKTKDDKAAPPVVVMPPEEEERGVRQTPPLTAAQWRCRWERERWETIRSEPGAMELYEEAFERSFQKGSCKRFAESAGMKPADAERLWDQLREGHCERVVRLARGRPMRTDDEARELTCFLGDGASDVADIDDKLVALEDRLIEEGFNPSSEESGDRREVDEPIATLPETDESDSPPEQFRTPAEEAEIRRREELARQEANARQARASQERFWYLYEPEEDPKLTAAENRERLRRRNERRRQAINAEFAEDERQRTLAATAELEARFAAEESRNRSRQLRTKLKKLACALVLGVVVVIVLCDFQAVRDIHRLGLTTFEALVGVFQSDDTHEDLKP